MSSIDSTNPANVSTSSNPAKQTNPTKQTTKNPHKKSNLKSILIVGNGGREYALGEHLAKDSRVGRHAKSRAKFGFKR